jgi:23S rRNA pseudouridine2605 synthase
MLLTNNGYLAQKMTHPSYEVDKTYQVTVTGHPTKLALAHLEKGVLLKEGYTAPAKVEVISEAHDTTTLEITIHEGRYHQVKRMFLRVGYEVVKLVRVRMGEYTLLDLEGQPIKQLPTSQNK